jgi:hypothetical protein
MVRVLQKEKLIATVTSGHLSHYSKAAESILWHFSELILNGCVAARIAGTTHPFRM